MEFEEACLEFHQEMINHALRLTGDRTRAQDIVQDSYIRAMQAWKRFEPEGPDARASVRAWMYRIVTNTFVNEYQHLKMQQRVAKHHGEDVMRCSYGNASFVSQSAADQRYDVGTSLDWHSPEHGTWLPGNRVGTSMVSYQPITQVIEASVNYEVHAAMNSLDQRQREIVERYYFNNETLEHIAEESGVTIGTVWSRLGRARKTLEPLLANYARKQWGLVVDARQDPTLLKAPKSPKRNANRIDRVVRNDDVATFDLAEATPDSRASG